VPANQRKVTRCDESSKDDEKGEHWKVDYKRKLN